MTTEDTDGIVLAVSSGLSLVVVQKMPVAPVFTVPFGIATWSR